MTTRRQFLQHAPALVAWGACAPAAFLQAAEQSPSERTGKILVVIQLSGGNDGLNTVIPFRNDLYRQARPRLAIPVADVLKIDDDLGWPPSMRAFAELLESGQLSVVQGVGYPEPNRSHFESMDIWHTCRRKSRARPDGWLGRALERLPPHESHDPLAMHLGPEQQPLALASRHIRVPSIRTIEQFRLKPGNAATGALVSELTSTPRSGESELLGFVQSSTTSALTVAERISVATGGMAHQPGYPATELGQKLGQVSKLIASGLSTSIYYLTLDGFDTHAQQSAVHAGLLQQLAEAVSAFLRDLTAHREADRVLVFCFSEFGRRVAENASEGTDHGTAAPVFLAGHAVKPGLLGITPDLSNLVAGDLQHSVDFRQVYACLLERWLGCDSQPILGEHFAAVDALRLK